MHEATKNIVQKLWGMCNILRDDGITYHQYVSELTYLLFLKMMAETQAESILPEGYRWATCAAGMARCGWSFTSACSCT